MLEAREKTWKSWYTHILLHDWHIYFGLNLAAHSLAVTAWSRNYACAALRHAHIEQWYLLALTVTHALLHHDPGSLDFCSGGPPSMTCGDARISIKSAVWGRSDNTVCTGDFAIGGQQLADVRCGLDVTADYVARCDGQHSCTGVGFDFGDPCYGTYKYTKIVIDCVWTCDVPVQHMWGVWRHFMFQARFCRKLSNRAVEYNQKGSWRQTLRDCLLHDKLSTTVACRQNKCKQCFPRVSVSCQIL